jgi:cysteine desulfuration protein SufE
MTNEVLEAQDELVEEFAFLEDWMDRYQYIIDLGRRLPAFPESSMTEEHKIKGCQSQVWFVAGMQGDRLHFEATSDAAIVSGLIALLLRIYNDRRPADILESSPDFVSKLGFEQHLSPTRSNGLASMLQAIHDFASEAARESR